MENIARLGILFAVCAVLFVTGCASQGQITRQDEMKHSIEKAKQGATLTCTTKAQCDKAFILAKLFVVQNSIMDIRYSGDTMILTFDPDYNGRIGMAAQKIPDVGESATINLIATCKNMNMMTVPGTYPFFDQCAARLMSLYTGFKPFIESRMR
jgi:hypothetical protein